MNSDNNNSNTGHSSALTRRSFLQRIGLGAAALGSTAIVGCQHNNDPTDVEPPVGKMTYRTNPKTGEKVSLLGYGMMRLPTVNSTASAREDGDAEIDQEMVNRQVDYAIEHGVNYFDTSPAYCKGRSEHCTGIALSRHKRSEFFIATKLSNFNPETWSLQAGIEMFENSLKELQVDYVDYLLLHGIGMGDDGMATYRARYEDNHLLDYLLEQRRKGTIRNLGFSYHGDIAVFDYLLSCHDRYRWDFVQIELNYLDWQHAREINERNTNAEYLYGELVKRNIPAVIMEPLLGGRLSHLPLPLAKQLLERDPQHSVASWAFRYAGSFPGVLTVLSGMTFMEHLRDNLRSYCPLVPLTAAEVAMLEEVANLLVGYGTIPCNDCKYCMPCPYGIDIPAVLLHYNRCLSEHHVLTDPASSDYAAARRAFLVGYDRAVPRLRQADHCIGCGQCAPHCPQRIRIPQELHRISDYAEALRRDDANALKRAAERAATDAKSR